MEKTVISTKRRRFIVVLVLVFVLSSLLGGIALASNMGFKLNYGVISAINALLKPSGYDESGIWEGYGSGLVFSTDENSSADGGATLSLRMPVGTIAVGLVPGGQGPAGKAQRDLFNYDVEEPLTFTSADGVAQISIWSAGYSNPMVRYSGTGFLMQTPGGQVAISASPTQITLQAGTLSTVLVLSDGAWVQQP